jgi:hypothetical protein
VFGSIETCVIVPPVRIAYKDHKRVEGWDILRVDAGMEGTDHDDVA